jgi:hypothetical protein
MPDIYRDPSIVTQGEIAAFFYRQDDPSSKPQFVGLFGESIIDSLEKPLGDLTPIYRKDPTRPSAFQIIRKTRAAPELGSLTINEYIKRNTRSLLEQMRAQKCDYVLIVKIDSCGRPDNIASWDSVWVISGAQLTSLNAGTLQQRDSEEAVETSADLSIDDYERLFPVGFGEKADSVVLAEGVDVVYADQQSCGSCAPFSNGCQQFFVLTKANAGSPGLSSQIVFTTNGTTFDKDDVNSLAGASGVALQAVGTYLAVWSTTDNAHHYALKADVTTTPNTYNWTRVSTGYVVAKAPTCAIALSPSQVFIGGQGGYVYQATDITSGVTVLHDGSQTIETTNAIHATGQTLVTVHNNNKLLVSQNLGLTFTVETGPNAGVNLTSVFVRGAKWFIVGDAQGKLWYTQDGGLTWTQTLLPDQGNLTRIDDIQFSPDFSEVGALAVRTSSAGYVYRTVTGGRIWANNEPTIRQASTAPANVNAVALCGVDAIAGTGKKVSSTDGVILVAG